MTTEALAIEAQNLTNERLLLAPIPLELLMLAKTSGRYCLARRMPSCRSLWRPSWRT